MLPEQFERLLAVGVAALCVAGLLGEEAAMGVAQNAVLACDAAGTTGVHFLPSPPIFYTSKN